MRSGHTVLYNIEIKTLKGHSIYVRPKCKSYKSFNNFLQNGSRISWPKNLNKDIKKCSVIQLQLNWSISKTVIELERAVRPKGMVMIFRACFVLFAN